MPSYLPWWAGAVALASVSLSHFLLVKRPLGVSSAFSRITAWSSEQLAYDEDLDLNACSAKAPPADYAAFLGAIFVGALVATIWRSGLPSLQTDLGPAHTALFGQGPGSWPLLFLGGLFVGFGTRLASGCTSGHGLVGVAGLRPSSLVATSTFMASAIALSLFLSGVAQ